MATQDSDGASDPPSNPSLTMFQQSHDHNNCPVHMSKHTARLDAIQVYNNVSTIPDDQRGRTNFLNLALEDIPTSAQCMRRGADAGTAFPTFEAAQEYRKILLATDTQDDPTIPRTRLQQRAHVMALYKAFKCIPPECEDRDDMKKWFVEQRHNNQLVEVKCWEIFQECVTRSLKNTNLVEAHEPNKFKFKAGKMTFAERFNIIKETMAISKTICKHLFDVSFVLKFVDDPAHNRARVESNRVLNGKKAEIMKRGKEEQAKDKEAKRPKLLRSISADPESGEELDDLEDSDYGATPEKKSTPRKTRSTRLRASTRAPPPPFPSTAPAGSMSAPQMRPNMHTPGRINTRNTSSHYEQSPLASYGSATGTDRMIDFSTNSDYPFLTPQNFSNGHHLRGIQFQQPREQPPLLLSSPFSPALRGGMMYASQNLAQQIMRPESAMSVASQHTVYQPMQDAPEPWNPLTPARHVSTGSSFYGSNDMSSNMSVTPSESTAFAPSTWNPPSTPIRNDTGGDWGRYNSHASQFPVQVSPSPVRPGGYMIPQEIAPIEQDAEEQEQVDPALTEGEVKSDGASNVNDDDEDSL